MGSQQVELLLEDAGGRLDKVLARQLPELSRAQWQRLISEGLVLVNGLPAKASQQLAGGELIKAEIPEPAESNLIPEDIALDIRYEDNDIIVVNKPAGMVVHPGPGHASGTLVNAILAHCPDLPGIGDTKRPGIVHRLDKDTSGLIIIAKNDEALRYLQAQFKARTVIKKYLALVDGHIQPSAALIDAPIGRDPLQRKVMTVISHDNPRTRSARAREAQTHYKVLTYYEDFSLVECAPHTGRTHQIRVHMAYIGFPIVGDIVYGRRKQRLTLDRHFLHAGELRIKRPLDGELLALEAELPEELQAVIDQLAKSS
ncbi:MAG: RluA family pseudouridine synthase [Candidatus Promineifilaceae bacterium]|jgi:23S rRNA pseudouridine1911/1915/1917 synthase